jgi:hypothetical protein
MLPALLLLVAVALLVPAPPAQAFVAQVAAPEARHPPVDRRPGRRGDPEDVRGGRARARLAPAPRTIMVRDSANATGRASITVNVAN